MSSRIPKLRRTAKERRQLWRNQVTSLFKHERIKTTLPKAKALVRICDMMITYAKRGTMADYRRAAAFIQEPMMVRKCFTEFASRYKFRPGGYARVVRTFNRRIDNAPMAYIELVDRVGEFRAPRQVNYLTAVEKKLVPAPISPIITPKDLQVASLISPSTSNRVSVRRPHFIRGVQPSHLTYYPDWTRRTHRLPIWLRRYREAVAKLENFKAKKEAQRSGTAGVAQQVSEALV